MTIKLKDINNLADIIKSNYAKHIPFLRFIFSYKISKNKYFIFQEIYGMPIQRFIYKESNNSIDFVAGWSSWANPYAFVADANNEKIEKWQDLLDRSRPWNSTINSIGAYNQTWTSNNRKNNKEKIKQHKTKIDTFFEFRIDQIERVYFYNWGFEIFSPFLSMIAIMDNTLFPYITNVDNSENLNEDNEEISNHHHHHHHLNPNSDLDITVTDGKTFNIDQKTEINSQEMMSYWDKNECDIENDEFDEEMREILLEEKLEKSFKVMDVGQRKVNLDL